MVGCCTGFDSKPSKPGSKNKGSATKLFLRADKPKGDALSYGSDDKGEFLGYCVGRLSMPRWMSGHFPAALKEGVAIERYSEDWVETILYVPTAEKPTAKEKTLINSLAASLPAMTHAQDQGCGCLVPITCIQAVSVRADGTTKLGAPDKKLYYAITSGFADGDVETITEWTVATQANRHKFENSKMHDSVLEVCKVHRKPKYLERAEHFAAIRNLPPEFVP